jgi:hypothetical protein
MPEPMRKRMKPPFGLHFLSILLFLGGIGWTAQRLEAAGATGPGEMVGPPIATVNTGRGSHVLIGRMSSYQPAGGQLDAADWPVFLPVMGGTLGALLLSGWVWWARRRATTAWRTR